MITSKIADPFALLFDLVFFVFGFVIEPILNRYFGHHVLSKTTSPGDETVFGLIVLGAIVAQALGLYLRRYKTANAVGQLNLWGSWFALPMFFILIAHISLFCIFLVIIGTSSFQMADTISISISLIAFVAMVWILVLSVRSKHSPSYTIDFGTELASTLLLIFSGTVLTSMLWGGLLTANIINGDFSAEPIEGKVGITLILLLFFGMYYLPARLSFLLCDFNKRQTWLRYAFVFLPLMQKVWL